MRRDFANAPFWLLLLAPLILLSAAPVGAWAQERPEGESAEARAPVVSLQNSLMAAMKNADELGFEGRLSTLAPVIESTFNLEFMAKTCIGRTWKRLSPELRAQWVGTFSRYTSSKLADQFDGFSGQRFVMNGQRPASNDTLVVLSSIEKPGRDAVRLDFRVRRATTGEWLIVDIYAKGRVSEVALRRSEFASILQKSDIAGLIESVDAYSDRIAEQAGS